MLQWSEGFTGHRIHMLPFSAYRIANRGSRDDGLAFISVGFRWPASVRSKRSKSRLCAMCCVVLTKLQSLFLLA
jgi:hypothetical protein